MREITTPTGISGSSDAGREPTVAELTEPYEPLHLELVPIDHNPRHDGQSWLRWQMRQLLGRP